MINNVLKVELTEFVSASALSVGLAGWVSGDLALSAPTVTEFRLNQI